MSAGRTPVSDSLRLCHQVRVSFSECLSAFASGGQTADPKETAEKMRVHLETFSHAMDDFVILTGAHHSLTQVEELGDAAFEPRKRRKTHAKWREFAAAQEEKKKPLLQTGEL